MDVIQEFLKEYAAYGYPVLFFGVLLENAGIPLPGETAVLVAGFLASPTGGKHFNLFLVMLITIVAAVIGDNVGYWIGRRWGRRFPFITANALRLAEGYFQRFGLWTIFFQRFITGIRVIGAVAAGIAGMHWPRFLFANAAGALAWSVTMSLLGYFFGESLDLLEKWLGRTGVFLLVAVLVAIIVVVFIRRFRKDKRKMEAEQAHPQPAPLQAPQSPADSSRVSDR